MLRLVRPIALLSAICVAACGTTSSVTVNPIVTKENETCNLKTDLAEITELTSELPVETEKRFEALLADEGDLEKLAERASRPKDTEPAATKLSCHFVEVQARALLLDVPAGEGDTDRLVAMQTAVETAQSYCAEAGDRRRCDALSGFYTPVAYSHRAISQLEDYAAISADEGVDWEAASLVTRELTQKVAEQWPSASQLSGPETASVDGGGILVASALDAELQRLSCRSLDATTRLSELALSHRLEDGSVSDYDLKGRRLRAQIVASMGFMSDQADCYERLDDMTCQRRLSSHLNAICTVPVIDASE